MFTRYAMQTGLLRLRLALHWVLLALAVGASFGAQAQQNWPNRPLRIIVPTPPAGSTDILARMVGQELSKSLGQQVTIDNRSGGSGNIAAAVFLNSAPDDHLFFLVHMPLMSINQYLYPSLTHNLQADTKAIGLLAGTPNVIVANLSLKVRTLKELVEYGKSHPLSYGSMGSGSTGHLLTELFKTEAGIELLHVPYRGNAPMVMALLSGEIQFTTDNIALELPHIQGGKLQPLAVTSPKRLAVLPDVPTVAEAGFPNLTMAGWWGLVAQLKAPPDVVARMNREVVAILKRPDFIAQLSKYSMEALPGTPEDMTATIDSDRKRWKKVIETSGAKAE